MTDLLLLSQKPNLLDDARHAIAHLDVVVDGCIRFHEAMQENIGYLLLQIGVKLNLKIQSVCEDLQHDAYLQG